MSFHKRIAKAATQAEVQKVLRIAENTSGRNVNQTTRLLWIHTAAKRLRELDEELSELQALEDPTRAELRRFAVLLSGQGVKFTLPVFLTDRHTYVLESS